MAARPANPFHLGTGGQRLWRQLVAQDASLDDELNPMRATAVEACRTQDRCDVLAALCGSEDVMIDNGKGQPVAHPAWVEARQQAALLARLIAALRLPDEATGARPQRRQVRGVQKPSAVSSLDRARERRTGS